MNNRSTTFFFGLLLTVLWLFGLMVARRDARADDQFILPTLQASGAKIESIRFDKGKESYLFEKSGDGWFLKTDDGRKIRMEGFKLDNLVRNTTSARRSDIESQSDLKSRGLEKPSLVVTFKGKPKGEDKEKSWSLSVGDQTPYKTDYFALSSDRPDKAIAVKRSIIDNLLFSDISAFRPQRPIDVNEPKLQEITLRDKTSEVVFKKEADGSWKFVKPALGLVDYEGSTPKEAPDKKDAAPKDSGLKSLLTSLAALRIDDTDFIPVSESKLDLYGLADDKSVGSIALMLVGDDGKSSTTESLLLGNLTPAKDKIYVRRAGDPGIGKMSVQSLEPILAAVSYPGSLRSLDLAHVEPKKVHAAQIKVGDSDIKLSQLENKTWTVQAGKETAKKASEKTATGWLDDLIGKRAIQKFLPADAKLEAPVAEIKLLPLAKDKEAAKPLVTLEFGKAIGDSIPVKRVADDGVVSLFTIDKSLFEKLVPTAGQLAFLDTALPTHDPSTVTSLVLSRGKETLTVAKEKDKKAGRWLLNGNLANATATDTLLRGLGNLTANKWIKKLDPKEDLAPFGLNTPTLSAQMIVKSDRLPLAGIASVVGLMTSQPSAILSALAHRQLDPGEKVSILFGKDADKDAGVYAQMTGSDLLFLADRELVKAFKEIDLRDLTSLGTLQPVLIAGAASLANETALASLPLLAPALLAIDPAKVQSVSLEVRTPEELRKFKFTRKSATDPWTDQSGLLEFQLDETKVKGLLEELSKLPAQRVVQLPGDSRGDYKFAAKEATLRVDLGLEGGQTTSLTVGALFEPHGFFAQSSQQPGMVFAVSPRFVEPLLRGAAYFGKERLARVGIE